MYVERPDKYRRSSRIDHIKADIIVLGCSLPGIVAAHKLKKKFGNTMEIVVLDLVNAPKGTSRTNVGFHVDEENNEYIYEGTARELIDNVARFYLNMFAKEFRLPLPDAIMAPEKLKTNLNKIFEHKNGHIVKCVSNLHDFGYLNILERFELNQYQMLLEQCMKDLFQANKLCDDSERQQLLYYDHTTMEQHICQKLIFTTSKEIMRNTVSLVCGISAEHVSVLFYLHQCYRTSSSRNHLDGNNTRFREKLLGYCRKHLASKLQKSIRNITLSAKTIKEISSSSEEKVILKTLTGDTIYVCDLLAMALKPDEISNIEFQSQLISEREAAILTSMKQGMAKRFSVQYHDNFWRKEGNSGDIFSVRGPIIWATERPKLSSTGSAENFSTIIGFLKTNNEKNDDSKEEVIKQLIHLFGEEAAEPVSYKETNIKDICIPLCGDFFALRKLTETPKHNLEWSTLDIFAEGDIAAALEAGHSAYLHLLTFLRPQATSYEDLCTEWPTFLNETPFSKFIAHINITSIARCVTFTAAAYVAYRLVKNLKS